MFSAWVSYTMSWLFAADESAVCIRWPKYWSFSFSISPSNEYSGLISFRMDMLDLFRSKGLSRVFSSTTVWKHQFFGAQPSLLSNSLFIGKDSDAGKDWRQEERGATDEMVGWHHWLNGHEFEQTPGDKEGQRRLVCSSHGVTKSWTERSNWTTTTGV